MSNIKALNNLNLHEWQITEQDINYYSIDLYFGFSDFNKIVKFENLHFGYILKEKNSEIIEQEQNFPPENIVYVLTDEDYIEVTKLNVEPNKKYNLYLYCNNNSIFSETNFIFTTPSIPGPVPPGPTGGTGPNNF